MGLASEKSRDAAAYEAGDRNVPPDVAYRQGWNDRVCRTRGDVGRWYRSSGAGIMSNSGSGYGDGVWTPEARAEYVRGWEEADDRIAGILLQMVKP